MEFSQLSRWGQKTATEPSVIWRYGFGVFAVLAATGVRLAFNPVVGVHAPHVLFVLAVIAAAWFGGRGPGLAATALSALSTVWFFIEPSHSFAMAHPEAIWGLTLFVFEGALIALLVGSLRESLLARVRTEDAWRRREQLIDLSHDGVITMDSHRRILTWNKGAEEMYGWSERDAVGKVFHQLLESDGDISIPEIDEIMSREGRWEGERRRTTRDGRRLVVDSSQVICRGEICFESCLV